MKRIKYLILALIFPLLSSAQTDMQIMQGLWVKVKAQLRDGSAIVDREGCGMDFLKFNFSEDGFVNSSANVLFDQFKFPYSVDGDTLQMAGTSFHVVRLTPDTLIISSFYATSEKTQEVNYTFVKVQTMPVAATVAIDTTLKDSVYTATPLLFPQHREPFIDLSNAINARFEIGELKISFVVDKKGRVKNYMVLGGDSISIKLSRSVNKALVSLSWQPAKRNNQPVNCRVTMNIHFKAQINDDRLVGTLDVSYPFLPSAPYPKLDDEEYEAEQDMFKEALAQYNNHNYVKAAELLSKCIEMDNIDLDAYYLRAETYSNLGKQANACKDWATLVGLGQAGAKKKLAERCKN